LTKYHPRPLANVLKNTSCFNCTFESIFVHPSATRYSLVERPFVVMKPKRSTHTAPSPWLTIAPDRIEPDRSDWQNIELYNKQLLCRALASQTTIAFAGAGMSLPHGLPLWGELYQLMFDHFEKEVNNNLKQLAKPLRVLADLNAKNKARREAAKKAGRHSDIDLPSAFQLLQSSLDAPGSPTNRTSQAQNRTKFTAVLENIIKDVKDLKPHNDPYLALLELPIRRFITANYDTQLEKAIEKVRGKDFDRSFTQKDQTKLPRFSLALAPGNHYMVFHCHGSIESLNGSEGKDAGTSTPHDGIVITEEDYKFWYLAESQAASGFRLLLDVILLSSPILFIGYGLGDDDLLRALRLLSLNREHSKANSNVFALMKAAKGPETELKFLALQNRYGINIIGIEIDHPNDLQTRLSEVKQEYLSEKLSWRLQPKGRQLKPDPVRYRLQPQNESDPLFSQDCIEKDPLFLRILEFLGEPKQSVHLLQGDVGAGKYVRVSQVLHVKNKIKGSITGRFHYVFFSSHDTDDLYLYLKKIVLAAEHFAFGTSPSASNSQGLISRLKTALSASSKKPICVVISGLDRFIQWTNVLDEPRKPNKLTNELIDFLENPSFNMNGGKVIVTTRFNFDKDSRESAQDLTKIPKDYALALASKFDIDADVLKILRMVNGHYSSFVIALAWLNSVDKKDRELALSDMVDRLTGALSERSSRLVRHVLRKIAPLFAASGPSIDCLETLLTFLSCLTRPFNRIVFDLSCNLTEGLHSTSRTFENLLRFRLIEIVNPSNKEGLYVVSPIVRQYCRTRRLGSTVVEVRAFGLHGYTSRGNFVDCGTSTVPGHYYSELAKKAKTEVQLFGGAVAGVSDRKQILRLGHVARTFIRASFDVLRSNFACNSVPRWGTFGTYVQMCATCFDLVKNYCVFSGECWQPESGNFNCVGQAGPLTPEEIVWLLNEMGLAYYGEGAVQDAVGVWGLAFEWQQSLRQVDSDQADMYSASLLCHIGAANLQIGRLDIAQGHFEKSLVFSRASQNVDLLARVLGFLARVEHFRGSVRKADEDYKEVLVILESSGNKRAQSYFMRHRAALQMRQGDLSLAERLIRDSMVLAAAENYPDFVAYSRELLARLMVRKGRTEEAAREYRLVLAEARRMGILRLEADALLGLARVQLELGDATVARRRALESLRIANRLILALRQDRALVVLGRAHVKLGEVYAGKQFLQLACELASSHEFRLIQNEAEEELSKIGGEYQVH
jgi:tetratricopeptide (TPR) repeat protein